MHILPVNLDDEINIAFVLDVTDRSVFSCDEFTLRFSLGGDSSMEDDMVTDWETESPFWVWEREPEDVGVMGDFDLLAKA